MNKQQAITELSRTLGHLIGTELGENFRFFLMIMPTDGTAMGNVSTLDEPALLNALDIMGNILRGRQQQKGLIH